MTDETAAMLTEREKRRKQNLEDLAGFVAFYARNLCDVPENIRVSGYADHDLGMVVLDMRIERDGVVLAHRRDFLLEDCLFQKDLPGMIRYRVEAAKQELWITPPIVSR